METAKARRADLARWLAGLVVVTAVFMAARRMEPPLGWRGAAAYWLHGFRHAGWGNLDLDWQANTTSLQPGFDLVIGTCQRVLPLVGHYLLFFALGALYLWALLSIGTLVHDDRSAHPARARDPIWYLGLVCLLSYAHWHVWWDRLGVPGNPIPGVATHFLLTPVLGPQMFGVLLVVSLALHLRARHYAAVVVAGLAALVHPTYLFSAGCLTLGYAIVLVVRRRDWRRAVTLGVVALIVVSPIVIYAQRHLGASSPQTFAIAQDILVEFRIPQHADPLAWFRWHSIAMIAIVVAAIVLERKTDLGIVLAVMLGLGTLVGLVVVIAHPPALATIMPWRVSATLMPVACTVLLGRGWRAIYDRFGAGLARHRALALGVGVVLAAIPAGKGMLETRAAFGEPQELDAVLDHVKTHGQRGEVYVIPTLELFPFRMTTGMPLFVDAQAHPFRDEEVVEWFSRLLIVDRLYGDVGREGSRAPDDIEAMEGPDCSLVSRLIACGVTHVIDLDDVIATACGRSPDYTARATYHDAHYAVLELHATAAPHACAIGATLAEAKLSISSNHKNQRLRIFGGR